MKVKELIEELSKLDPEALVVLSRDEEGNGYSELADIASNYKFNGEDIGHAKLTPKLKKQGYTEEDVMEAGDPCVILWP